MKLTLKRLYMKNDYTIGKLYIDDVYFCDTLEDRVREINTAADKVYGNSAIPEGFYRVKMTYSAKYKKIMPQLLDVPYFDCIRIHSGNTAADTEGCVLVGVNNVVGKVTNSRATYRRLMERIGLENDLVITIKNVGKIWK